MPIISCDMMISEEQVRRAVDYLRTSGEYTEPAERVADPEAIELVDRVVEALRGLPDVRDDRVEHARLLLRDALPSSDELASKLIGRVLSDSIR
jgi:hypothetical protein